ncbi:hypothetical protein GJ496_006786, partial [Pomphorhynchus laevis]
MLPVKKCKLLCSDTDPLNETTITSSITVENPNNSVSDNIPLSIFNNAPIQEFLNLSTPGIKVNSAHQFEPLVAEVPNNKPRVFIKGSINLKNGNISKATKSTSLFGFNNLSFDKEQSALFANKSNLKAGTLFSQTSNSLCSVANTSNNDVSTPVVSSGKSSKSYSTNVNDSQVFTSTSAYLSSVRKERRLLPKRVTVSVKHTNQPLGNKQIQNNYDQPEDKFPQSDFIGNLLKDEKWQKAVLDIFLQCTHKISNICSNNFDVISNKGTKQVDNGCCSDYNACATNIVNNNNISNDKKPSLMTQFNFESVPKLSQLLQLPQCHILELIDNRIEQVMASGFDYYKGVWLYSLLVFLVKPLLPDTIASLRLLTRYLINKCKET